LPAALKFSGDHAAWHPQRQGARRVRLTGVFPLSGMVPDLVMAGLAPGMTKIEILFQMVRGS
jgi:hypothetical protein